MLSQAQVAHGVHGTVPAAASNWQLHIQLCCSQATYGCMPAWRTCEERCQERCLEQVGDAMHCGPDDHGPLHEGVVDLQSVKHVGQEQTSFPHHKVVQDQTCTVEGQVLGYRASRER